MLDEALIAQLKTHFASLSSEFTLRIYGNDHPKAAELEAMLRDVAQVSDRIQVAKTPGRSGELMFEINRDGEPLGIRFLGIPGGHEFSSLVLAILNADGKGKLPDSSVVRQVQALKRPIHLRTFVSLSCTNCPDVVQALNQLTLASKDISHDFVDVALHQDEAKRLGIQGVPAVFEGDEMLHLGRAGLAELLEVITGRVGVSDTGATAVVSEVYDVAVLGGGPAGVSAAIYSARKGLKTALVAKRVGGQVNDTLGIENLISVPYTEGKDLSGALAGHLRGHEVDLFEHQNIVTVRPGKVNDVVLGNGDVVRGEQLIVATGAKWRTLGVQGESEYTGRGVAFCPHCDGPFFKGKRVAVIGGGNSGIEAAIDLAGICSDVTVFEFADALKADGVLLAKLDSLSNVTVILGARTTEVVGDGTKVTGIKWVDRATDEQRELLLDGIFVQIGLVPNSEVVKEVVALNRMGEIEVDSGGRTSTENIFAAGDVTDVPFKQIVISMGDGAKAALTAFDARMRRAS